MDFTDPTRAIAKRCNPTCKVKLKVTFEQATKAQKGSKDIALLFL